jgi:hypothetical protein
MVELGSAKRFPLAPEQRSTVAIYDTPGRIDVKIDIFVRIFAVEEKKLCHNAVSYLVVYRRAQYDDALF